MKTGLPPASLPHLKTLAAKLPERLLDALLRLPPFGVTVKHFDAQSQQATLLTPAGPLKAFSPQALQIGAQYKVQAEQQGQQLILRIQPQASGVAKTLIPIAQINSAQMNIVAGAQPGQSATVLSNSGAVLTLSVVGQSLKLAVKSPFKTGQTVWLQKQGDQLTLQRLDRQHYVKALVQNHLPLLLKSPANILSKINLPPAAPTVVTSANTKPNDNVLKQTVNLTPSAPKAPTTVTEQERLVQPTPALPTSAKAISPAQLQQTLPRIENLSADQLKLWLTPPLLNPVLAVRPSPGSPPGSAQQSGMDSLLRLLFGMKQSFARASPHSNKRPAAETAAPSHTQSGQNITQALEQTVVRQLLQLASQSLHNDTDQPLNLQFGLPLQWQEKTTELKMRLREFRQQEEDSTQSHWEIQLSLEIPGLGPLETRVLVQQNTLHLGFWAEQADTVSLLEAQQNTLQQRLNALGFQVPRFAIHSGPAPRREDATDWYITEPQGLLNIEV